MTPARSTLRIADLKRRPRATARLINVRVPVSILDAVERLARELGASKTETVAALLNSAMDQARKR
ncbi:MAG TPA: hypothetical protein VN812_11535 [Candidatus Acidoferrales bacterium]|nr:hypothetical protein [Candidatus Acidoferrales bacterium]